MRILTIAAALALSAAAQAQRPNVVYIMADDLGYGELGSYGQTKIRTPHLDKLAAAGMRFMHHYTSAPVCAPARCSLMTGEHGGHALVRDNFRVGTWESHEGQLPLAAGTQTVATLFKERDYATGAFGKWGLGGPESTGHPLRQGFDRFFGYLCQRHAHNYYPRYLVDDHSKHVLEGNDRGVTGKQYAPALIADELLRFVRAQHEAKKPFFVYYAAVIPHLALQVPDAELAAYDFDDKPYTGKSYQPHPRPKAAYAAMITYLDKQVGRLVALLEELHLTDDTLVVFTSDNGTTHLGKQVDYEFFKSVGELRGLKGSVYEGGIRVPMIATWPGHIKAGTSSDHLSAHYDVLATVADLLDVDAKPNDGVSFLPTLLDKGEQESHNALVWDFAGYGGQIALRRGRYKIVQRNLRKSRTAHVELFDLDEDPGETRDLASEQPDLAKELHDLLIRSRTKPTTEKFRFGRYAHRR